MYFCVCKIVSKMSDILCLYYVSKTSHKMLVMPETDFYLNIHIYKLLKVTSVIHWTP